MCGFVLLGNLFDLHLGSTDRYDVHILLQNRLQNKCSSHRETTYAGTAKAVRETLLYTQEG